jgi:hypothetical protein
MIDHASTIAKLNKATSLAQAVYWNTESTSNESRLAEAIMKLCEFIGEVEMEATSARKNRISNTNKSRTRR